MYISTYLYLYYSSICIICIRVLMFMANNAAHNTHCHVNLYVCVHDPDISSMAHVTRYTYTWI